MDQNQQYLIEVLVRKVTLELLNPLQNRIMNLQQDFNNMDSSLNKQTQAIQIMNQQIQQRQQQDSIYLKNFNDIHTNIAALEEKQTLVIATQNQTFTNLIDRIEHYSQQLNDRSEKLRDLQQQQLQLKTEFNFAQQTQQSSLDGIQKRLNSLITSNKEESDSFTASAEQIDMKMKYIMEKIETFQDLNNKYSSNMEKFQSAYKNIDQICSQFDEIKEQMITKEEFESQIKRQNDQIASELNTQVFKQQQQLSQNNRLITQVQTSLDEASHDKLIFQRDLNSLTQQFRNVKEDLEIKVLDMETFVRDIKVNQEAQYMIWDNTFEGVQKSLDQYKFDFASIKQNFKKNLLKYEGIFEAFKEKCSEEVTQITTRITNNQKLLIEDKIAQIDNHIMEEIQSIQEKFLQYQQLQMPQATNIQNQIKPVSLQIPQSISEIKQRKISQQFQQQDIIITNVNLAEQLKSRNESSAIIDYQPFSKKQSKNQVVDNSEFIELKQQFEKMKEQQKSQLQIQQNLDKELKSTAEKVKKQHERIEFFFLQTKTQLNKCTSKLDTLQSDTKQIIVPENGKQSDFIDIDQIHKQIEQLQGWITKIRSDMQNDANYAQSQIKSLQKIRDQIMPLQQEQAAKMEQLDECQKMMLLVLLQNELVQLSHEDGLYKIDNQVNNLHFEFQPGMKDEKTHMSYRQQRISKVDFIMNQILGIKKISMHLSRMDHSAILSQSSTLRKSQTNRQKSVKNNSVILGKSYNDSTKVTMRNTIMTVEKNEKYLNRKKYNICNDSFKQTKVCFSQQKLYSSANDETF